MVPSLAFDRNKNQPTFNNQNTTNPTQPNQNPTNVNNSTNQTLPKQKTTHPQKPPTFHCTFHHLQLARLGFIHFGSRHTSGHNTADGETWRRSCRGGLSPSHPSPSGTVVEVGSLYIRWGHVTSEKWPKINE